MYVWGVHASEGDEAKIFKRATVATDLLWKKKNKTKQKDDVNCFCSLQYGRSAGSFSAPFVTCLGASSVSGHFFFLVSAP